MKKLLSISDNVSRQLEQHAKENSTTQSKVVEVAISLYLAMYQGAKTMASNIDAMNIDHLYKKSDSPTKKNN